MLYKVEMMTESDAAIYYSGRIDASAHTEWVEAETKEEALRIGKERGAKWAEENGERPFVYFNEAYLETQEEWERTRPEREAAAAKEKARLEKAAATRQRNLEKKAAEKNMTVEEYQAFCKKKQSLKRLEKKTVDLEAYIEETIENQKKYLEELRETLKERKERIENLKKELETE